MYTEADIRKPDILEIVDKCIHKLHAQLDGQDSVPVKDTALVIEPPSEEEWGYYFVDHVNRTLFWLEEFELPVHELDGEPTFSLLRKDSVDMMGFVVYDVLSRT